MTVALVLLGVLAAALAVALRRAARDAESLRRRVTAATRELEHTQDAFSRFAPRRVVDDVLREGVSRTAERREVTVLFADLCGFTKMSSTLEPDVVVRVLNRYFEAASAAVTAHRGHVSKFIGDGILALFGAVDHNPWQAQDAARAGLAMVAAVKQLSAQNVAEGLPALEVSIGIHRGEVVAGVVGSRHLVEFTVLGHHVNVAARVEGLTRKVGAPLLVTSAVREQLGEQFDVVEQAPQQVKGVDEAIVTWAVRGERARP